MSASFRPKACIGCAESKRRCDRGLPECQRCLDRDVDCSYPQPKRRRRDRAANAVQPNITPLNYDLYPQIQCDFADMDFNYADFDGDWADLATRQVSAIPAHHATSTVPRAVPDPGREADNPWPLLLGEDAWAMEHNHQEPHCPADAQIESFLKSIHEMMASWVRKGYNSFVHQRLYHRAMPACIQEAFTTLAAYSSATPAVKGMVLQIAGDRAVMLISQSNLVGTIGMPATRDHLARVQALFIYQVIGLLDGSVSARSSAEKQIPTLRRWVAQMWEAAKHWGGEDDSLGYQARLGLSGGGNFDQEYDRCASLWSSWIVTESVRRSQLVIDAFANVYASMTGEIAECTGVCMFTGWRGLWEAESAMEWYGLATGTRPLLLPSLRPGALIAQYPAESFDDFAKFLWMCALGTDKMESWISSTSS